MLTQEVDSTDLLTSWPDYGRLAEPSKAAERGPMRTGYTEFQWPCHKCGLSDQPYGTIVCRNCGHNLMEPSRYIDGRLLRECEVSVKGT